MYVCNSERVDTELELTQNYDATNHKHVLKKNLVSINMLEFTKK